MGDRGLTGRTGVWSIGERREARPRWGRMKDGGSQGEESAEEAEGEIGKDIVAGGRGLR